MRAKIVLALSLALCGAARAQAPAASGKPSMPPVCGTCHKAAPGNLQGYFDNVSFKSTSIQLNVGSTTEIVKFDPVTVRVIDAGSVKKSDHLREVRQGHETRIDYVERDGVKVASIVSLKGPIKIAPDKLVSYADVEKLVFAGPEKADYVLIDSRPAPRFQDGTIPTAINLPFPAFDKFVDRLPSDRNTLIVFFCQGATCMMSPSSLRRAEAMGYTNAKVYREGWPEWTQKNYGVIAPKFVKEAFIDPGIPHVLLDVRAAGEAQRTGFIPGTVQLPADKVKAALNIFPDQELKAPIMVYDLRGGEDAVRAARTLVQAGYENVLVVTGGLAGWKAAGYELAIGTPASKVAYTPKPRPGSLPIDEFRKLAGNTPADTLILDVRSADEARGGMIRGALLIPDEELLARIAELPAGKRIITHCSSGVRAEMAYHKLKDKGYNVAFLHAEVAVAKDGSARIAAP
jgi:rhodanese-related sulfurtransferase